MRKLLIFLTLVLASCALTSKDMELIKAAEKGDLSKVTTLIKEGANINAEDTEGWTPYLAASTTGHFEIANLLKGLGADTRTKHERDPLK